MAPIQQKLSKLRNRIRSIVVVDALLAILICFAIGFVVAFCLDYLPVWFGMTELPVIPRFIMLLGIFGVGLFLLATLGIGRLLTKLPDESLKLLIERAHPEFSDTLLTLNDETGSNATERQRFMLDVAEQDAVKKLESVNTNDVVSYTAIKWKFGSLLGFVAAFLITFLLAPDLVSKGFRRTFLLSTESLPRQSALINARIRVLNDDEFIARVLAPEFHLLRPSQVTKLATGSKIEFTIEAIAKDESREYKIPRSCSLRYQLDDGRRGSVVLNQAKRNAGGSVSFASQKGTLDGLNSSGQVWVQGFDCTVGPFEIEWVDAPAMETISKSATYPAYLVEHSNRWQNGTSPLLNNEQLPIGTELKLLAVTNRIALSQVVVWDNQLDRPVKCDLLARQATEIHIPFSLDRELLDVSIAMVDADGITSKNAFRIRVRGIADLPPTISVTPLGIGSAITENAKIPVEITAADEFGISSGNIDLVSDDTIVASRKFRWNAEERQTVEVDLLELRRAENLVLPKDANGKSKLMLQTFLKDHNPNNKHSIGQEYEFEIVSESKFLQLIEREEAGLRKRLEAVEAELDGARGLLLMYRTAVSIAGENRKLDSSPIWLQRVRLQVQKSSLEINDIANAFGRLIDQLQNNRVDVSKKQGRLVNDVKLPLLELVESDMADLASRLHLEANRIRNSFQQEIKKEAMVANDDLKVQIAESFAGTSEELLVSHESIIKQLDTIIQRLAKFESYSELLDVVRGLIDEQKTLIDQTQKERDRKAFDSLLD